MHLGGEPLEGLLAADLDGLVRVDHDEDGADGGEDLLLIEAQAQRVQDRRVGDVLQQHLPRGWVVGEGWRRGGRGGAVEVEWDVGLELELELWW